MKTLVIDKNKVGKLPLAQPLTASLALVTGANFTIAPALPTATPRYLNPTGAVVWGTGPELSRVRSLVNHLLELAAWVEQAPGLNLSFKNATRPKKLNDLNDNDSASVSSFESHQQYRSGQTRYLRYCLDQQALAVLSPPQPQPPSLPLPLPQVTSGYTLEVVRLGKVLAELDGYATWTSHNVWRWQREGGPATKSEKVVGQRLVSKLDPPYPNLNLTLGLLEMLTTRLRQGLHGMVNAFVFGDVPLADHITAGQAVTEGMVRRLKQELLTQLVTAPTPDHDQALLLLLQTVYYLQYIDEQIIWGCRQVNTGY